MNFYIKEWPDRSASLMTAAGRQLFTFKSIDSALTACGDWYGINKNKVIPAINLNAGRPRSFVDLSAANNP